MTETPAIEAVVILACDRPDHLGRALESVAGGEVEVVVMDDSRDPANVEKHRALAKAAGARFGGPTEKRAYAGRLASAAGVELRRIEEALFGVNDAFRAGVNRNAAYLDQVGRLFVSMDDDTVARVAPSPNLSEALEIRSKGDPTEFWFYGTDDEALDRELSPRMLDVHARALGLRDGPRRVAVTACGVAGDSGMGTTAYYASRTGDTRVRLLEDYEINRLTRSVFRSAPHLVLTDATFLMTTCVGFDTRELLPPFFFAGRNSDGTFGVTLRAVTPHLIAHLPYAIEHRPDPRTEESMTATFGQIRINDLVSLAVRSTTLRGTIEDRTVALGEHLLSWADDPEELQKLLHHQRIRQLSVVGASLSDLLRKHGHEHEGWTADVKRILRVIEETALTDRHVLPCDLEGDTAELFERFGRLLIAWPEIDRAARGLAADGVRISR